jgi:hypothetical protein
VSKEVSRTQETAAHPGLFESFAAIEARAREILRERGYTDQQIENELNRPKRANLDD